MQRPPKPNSLTELPKEIERFKDEQLNLDRFQVEYKNEVGLSGHTRNNLPFHPKALQNELNDTKEHFANLSKNYVECVAREKFLQFMLQEPPLEITEAEQDQASEEEKILKKEVDHYLKQVEELGQQISTQAQLVEQNRSKAQDAANKATFAMDQITDMEEEIARIDKKVSNQSQFTVAEAKSLLDQQTKEITKLHNDLMEKKLRNADLKWNLEDSEAEVRQLEATAEKKKLEEEQAVINKRNRDRNVEESYYRYLDATDLCNQLFGVETIKFESDSSVFIYFMKPRDTVLHVEIDISKNQIRNAKVNTPES
ncbi:hypothetical protein HMPREF1544_07068 [Mucor circinelloides 1006PhL]|uniref:Kinetochore protein Sos7 coiled-coil domain-containing protein n=1 Tax=Mucor circinelloides f. circinelloides (strain 1006PhL) TaxID=1220926 RepID=S2J7P5_MUCC1|nr:hypothetical protein HMPREF1544_07068 [Mucor circinelloides 1006PhL]